VTRMAKISVTAVRVGDRIAPAMGKALERVYRVRDLGRGVWEISSTAGGTDVERKIPATRTVWIEIP
jgi:hypothetical protein